MRDFLKPVWRKLMIFGATCGVIAAVAGIVTHNLVMVLWNGIVVVFDVVFLVATADDI